MGFGPTTSTLARLRSTPELYPHHLTKMVYNILFYYCKKKFYSFGIFYLTFCIYADKIIYSKFCIIEILLTNYIEFSTYIICIDTLGANYGKENERK